MTKIFPGLHRLTVLGAEDSREAGWCRYGFYNSLGGTSENDFTSLNIGRNVGDKEENVAANRRLIKKSLGISHILSANQLHGVNIYSLKEKTLVQDLEVGGIAGCDALITDCPGVGLMVQHADCQPVLLYDPVKRVIGAVHCGWRGSVQNILALVVQRMGEEFGVAPGNIHGVIGPSLGPCCGEFTGYKEELPKEFVAFMITENHFDFWKISHSQLVASGLRDENIFTEEVCTACSRDWFSYRRASRETKGVTGRNCSVIALI